MAESEPTPAQDPQEVPPGAAIDVHPGRVAEVGGHEVVRVLPTRARRMVGAWCFADHIGPRYLSANDGESIAPHPHIGLQTVTWLLGGELVHRDSLGSEQLIRPGGLNLMTAGAGVAHSEEGVPGWAGSLHGIQLWVAQPDSTRDLPPAFEHHQALPELAFSNLDATVMVGCFGGAVSPARTDTDHAGVQLTLGLGKALLPLEPTWEYGLIMLSGLGEAEGEKLAPGSLYYLGGGRDELELTTLEEGTAILLGGIPFQERILMWWNFVARGREEVEAAYRQWQRDDRDRFPAVASKLARIPAPRPMWLTSGA
ncbi:MAG: pirin family protein [Actinomycetota bacterium]|nr:pirin family protein [Actinomycetota bacterium]